MPGRRAHFRAHSHIAALPWPRALAAETAPDGDARYRSSHLRFGLLFFFLPLFLLQPAVEMSLNRRLYQDGRALILGDWLLTNDTRRRWSSLFPHRRTPFMVLTVCLKSDAFYSVSCHCLLCFFRDRLCYARLSSRSQIGPAIDTLGDSMADLVALANWATGLQRPVPFGS